MHIRAPLILMLCCAPAWAQDQPEVSSQETPVQFSSRVNLVSVPVVVRDRDGKAIGNLKKEDFQLFDKGKPQVITKFTVEKSEGPVRETKADVTGEGQPGAAAAQPTLPDRYVAYLFDDVHLKRGDLLQSTQAVNRHLDETLDAHTRAAVFTTSGIMLSDFTNDLAKLHKAINSVQPWTSGPDARQDCPPVSYYTADLLVNKLLYFSGYLFTDAQLAAMINNGQADQTLIAVVTEAEQCAAASNATQVIQRVRITVRQALTYGDRETVLSLGAVKDVIRRLSHMPGSRNLVLVSPGFLITFDRRGDEYDVLDTALRANVAVNTIDMRGVYTLMQDTETQAYGSIYGGILTQADIAAASAADDVLGELADGTGGKFFHDDNGLKEGMNQLAARPEYLYVLGFSPENLKSDGSYHPLKVTLHGIANVNLQVRHGYWAPRHAVDSAEAAKEEISDAVFSRDEMTGIPLDLQTEFFKPSDEKAELTVSTHVKADALRFRKANDRNNDTVTVVAGLFDANGNYISGMERVISLHLRDQSLASVERSGILVQETFHVSPGRYVVRVVVRDGEGQNMAARNGGVEIP